MRLIDFSGGFEALLGAIERGDKADYIYMYPPRQAYREIDAERAELARSEAILESNDVDLYLHFPFCRQICSFCNLFAAADTSMERHSRYVDAIRRELLQGRQMLEGKAINSIYFGGGTPSLLSTDQLVETMKLLGRLTSADLQQVPEISMEVAPDTVTREKFRALVDAGLSRVNVGAQSLNQKEVGIIGRKHDGELIVNSIETLLEVGIDNVSVDLIISLPGQSMEDWINSIEGVIGLNPDTICLYPFTQRPMTGFGKLMMEYDDQRYLKWEYAKTKLANAGFECETHVRWKRGGSKGGYIQKRNHWGLKNILGFGAGARSYTSRIDTRNGYGLRNRSGVVQNYIESIECGRIPIKDGYVMSMIERKRKAVVLNLISLDRSWYYSLFDSDPESDFPAELAFLKDNGLISVTNTTISTTDIGLKYRDLVVQLFFSDQVRALVRSHDYREVKNFEE